MVVPYGNYLAFRDAHPNGEDNMYRIDNTFSKGDHFDAGTQAQQIDHRQNLRMLQELEARGKSTKHKKR